MSAYNYYIDWAIQAYMKQQMFYSKLISTICPVVTWRDNGGLGSGRLAGCLSFQAERHLRRTRKI